MKKSTLFPVNRRPGAAGWKLAWKHPLPCASAHRPPGRKLLGRRFRALSSPAKPCASCEAPRRQPCLPFKARRQLWAHGWASVRLVLTLEEAPETTRQLWAKGRAFGGAVPSPQLASAHKGFSLIELMLAMALGLLVVLGVTQQFLGGRAAGVQLADAADVQDAAAYALGFLRRSARAAGYLGCGGRAMRLHNALNGAWGELFEANLTQPVQGFDYTGNGVSANLQDWSPSLASLPRREGGGTVNALTPGTGLRTDQLVPGADVIVFRHVQGPLWPLAVELAPNGEPLVADIDADNLEAGDLALVSDCQQGALFRITGMSPTAAGMVLRRASGGGPYGNRIGATLSPSGLPYGGGGLAGAAVGRVVAETYFIAAGAAPGATSLWRRAGAQRPAELVEGVADLQVQLGVNLDAADGRAGLSRYVPFGAVQENMAIRALSFAVTVQRGAVRRRFAQTVALRNL